MKYQKEKEKTSQNKRKKQRKHNKSKKHRRLPLHIAGVPQRVQPARKPSRASAWTACAPSSVQKEQYQRHDARRAGKTPDTAAPINNNRSRGTGEENTGSPQINSPPDSTDPRRQALKSPLLGVHEQAMVRASGHRDEGK